MIETDVDGLTPRARRRKARLAAILDAAMQLLINEGLDGMTIHSLAKAVDYTPGALYHYFPSKEAIIAELQVQIFSELHGLFKAVWSICDRGATERGLDADVAGLVKVLATADFYTALSKNKPQRFAMINVAMGEQRQLLSDEKVSPVADAVMGIIEDVGRVVHGAVLSEGLEGNESSSAQRAVTLWSSLHGVLLLRKFSRFDSDLIQASVLATRLSRDLIMAWGAERETLELADAELSALVAGKSMFEMAVELLEGE